MGSSNSEWLIVQSLIAAQQQQRFYLLRFMWATVDALEELGLPTENLEELRGIYTGLAEGTLFSDFINQQKEAGSEGNQPQS